jgi:hypothetical protein
MNKEKIAQKKRKEKKRKRKRKKEKELHKKGRGKLMHTVNRKVSIGAALIKLEAIMVPPALSIYIYGK